MPAPIPDRDGFRAAARRSRIVAVRTELLADQITPVAVFQRLCGDGPGFLLESVDHGGRWSRWSFVGRGPLARVVARGGRVEVVGDIAAEISSDGAVLDTLSRLLDTFAGDLDPDLPPFHGGVVGYIGYDVVREVEELPDVPRDDREWPDAVLSVVGDIAALDHWSQRAVLIANVMIPPGADDATLDAIHAEALGRLEAMSRDGANPVDEPLVDTPGDLEEMPDLVSSMPPGVYESAVEVAKEHIRAGDIFQVVLSQRFDVNTTADPFDVYRVLRQINPSPYMYFLREPELTIVGCSPEPMVQLRDRTVVSRPIAGTRFRGRTDEADRRLAAELSEHPKERAEHIMLVDLARNDVGRVVDFGTCQVDELMTLERFSHVMHLTSQVSGRLRADKGAIDVLAATMPAGTVSGAPKVRAMEIIDELEPVKRGPYAGVVGYLDFSGNIDTAIAIRTMIIDTEADDRGHRRASVQAGAGVVADSVAEDEELETRNKARALLVALRPAERMTRHRRELRSR